MEHTYVDGELLTATSLNNSFAELENALSTTSSTIPQFEYAEYWKKDTGVWIANPNTDYSWLRFAKYGRLAVIWGYYASTTSDAYQSRLIAKIPDGYQPMGQILVPGNLMQGSTSVNALGIVRINNEGTHLYASNPGGASGIVFNMTYLTKE